IARAFGRSVGGYRELVLIGNGAAGNAIADFRMANVDSNGLCPGSGVSLGAAARCEEQAVAAIAVPRGSSICHYRRRAIVGDASTAIAISNNRILDADSRCVGFGYRMPISVAA